MNPLSDLGMPDWFWKKYSESCSKIDGLHPECECGSGLPITQHRVPIRTKKGIVWPDTTRKYVETLEQFYDDHVTPTPTPANDKE